MISQGLGWPLPDSWRYKPCSGFEAGATGPGLRRPLDCWSYKPWFWVRVQGPGTGVRDGRRTADDGPGFETRVLGLMTLQTGVPVSRRLPVEIDFKIWFPWGLGWVGFCPGRVFTRTRRCGVIGKGVDLCKMLVWIYRWWERGDVCAHWGNGGKPAPVPAIGS